MPDLVGLAQQVTFDVIEGDLYAPEPPTLGILTPTLVRAPTVVRISIVNAVPNQDFIISIDDEELWVVTSDPEGMVDAVEIPVDDQDAGTHTVEAVSLSDTLVGEFTLEYDAPPAPPNRAADLDPIAVPEAVDGSRFHWVLQDLLPVDGLGSWVMPISPTSMSNPHLRKNASVVHTTSPNSGQFHVSEAWLPPTDWQFAGYCPDQAFHDHLTAYADLNRRFYVIDHRGRAWTVAALGVEIKPRQRQREDGGVFNDWAGDYTFTVQLLDQDWKEPV